MTDPETNADPNTTAYDMFQIVVKLTERAEASLQDARRCFELGLPSNLDYALRFKAAADALLKLCTANLLSGSEVNP